LNQSFGDRAFALSFLIDPELLAMGETGLAGCDGGIEDGDSSSLNFTSSIDRFDRYWSYDG